MINGELMGLDMLNVGESGYVDTLPLTAEKRRRLMALGLIKGTKITVVNQSPLGDPKAYFFRGSVIALRKSDACTIKISRKPQNQY